MLDPLSRIYNRRYCVAGVFTIHTQERVYKLLRSLENLQSKILGSWFGGKRVWIDHFKHYTLFFAIIVIVLITFI